MRRNALTTIVAVVAAFTVGLTWSYFTSGQTGGVAIVDLDEVARRLGRDQEMVKSIQSQAGALNQKLVAAQESANQQLGQIRDGLGQDPTEEQAKEFVLVRRNAQVQLNQLEQNAQVVLNQHRQGLVNKFREDAKPIAERVASERGLATVVTANDTVVFSFDNSVDITEDVIKLMSAEVPAPASAPVTKPPTAAQSQPATTPERTAQAPTSRSPNSSNKNGPTTSTGDRDTVRRHPRIQRPHARRLPGRRSGAFLD